MGNIIFIIIILFVFAFNIYDSVPSKYYAVKKIKGYDEKALKEFEYQKFSLHIVHCGSGTGKTYFVEQYLEIYKEEERPIIVVCQDNSNWEGYATVGV